MVQDSKNILESVTIHVTEGFQLSGLLMYYDIFMISDMIHIRVHVAWPSHMMVNTIHVAHNYTANTCHSHMAVMWYRQLQAWHTRMFDN